MNYIAAGFLILLIHSELQNTTTKGWILAKQEGILRNTLSILLGVILDILTRIAQQETTSVIASEIFVQEYLQKKQDFILGVFKAICVSFWKKTSWGIWKELFP